MAEGDYQVGFALTLLVLDETVTPRTQASALSRRLPLSLSRRSEKLGCVTQISMVANYSKPIDLY